MIPLTDIEIMREILESLFDRTITVKRPQHVSDGAGSWTLDTVTVGEYPCYIRPDRVTVRSDTTAATAETLKQKFLITLPHNADIIKGDIVEATEGVMEILEIRKGGSSDIVLDILTSKIQ